MLIRDSSSGDTTLRYVHPCPHPIYQHCQIDDDGKLTDRVQQLTNLSRGWKMSNLVLITKFVPCAIPSSNSSSSICSMQTATQQWRRDSGGFGFWISTLNSSSAKQKQAGEGSQPLRRAVDELLRNGSLLRFPQLFGCFLLCFFFTFAEFARFLRLALLEILAL